MGVNIEVGAAPLSAERIPSIATSQHHTPPVGSDAPKDHIPMRPEPQAPRSPLDLSAGNSPSDDLTQMCISKKENPAVIHGWGLMIRINLRKHSSELPAITQPIMQMEPMCCTVGLMWWKERHILAWRLSQLIQPNWKFNGHRAQNTRIEPKTLQRLVHFVKYDPFIWIFVSTWFIGQPPTPPTHCSSALRTWMCEVLHPNTADCDLYCCEMTLLSGGYIIVFTTCIFQMGIIKPEYWTVIYM